MPEIMPRRNIPIRFGSMVTKEEVELELRLGLISINPPPSDGRCQCCGSHLSKLRPFGKCGDPLLGDFEGELLVRCFRPIGPCDEEAERIYEKYLDRARSELRYEGAEPVWPAGRCVDGPACVWLPLEDRLSDEEDPVRLLRADLYWEEVEIIGPFAQEKEEQLLAADYATEQAEPITLAVMEEAELPSLAVAERAKQLMAQDLGTERAERIMAAVRVGCGAVSSWECRDCIVLGTDDYAQVASARMEAGT